jgi:probable HAF family extracellular repeat protein
VNNRGQIVGMSLIDGPHGHAFLWHEGRMLDLGTLPGDNHSAAYAINDRGQVVGVSANIEQSTARAFIWEDGVMRDLGLAPGTTFATANDVNELGLAAGVSGTTRPLAVTFFRGIVARLPARPGEVLSIANGINDRGDVVGYSATDQGSVAVLWLRTR